MIEHLRGRERALEPLGWTGREAEWIAVVCLHSGVFTRAQFCHYFNTQRMTALRFVKALIEQRAAVETITGKFRSADERELVLEQDGLLRRVSRAEIRRVILYKGRHAGRGALWGLGIGAASGLVAGIASRDASEPLVIPVTLLLSGLGAGIGALLGTLVRERAVIYEVP